MGEWPMAWAGGDCPVVSALFVHCLPFVQPLRFMFFISIKG